MNILGISSSHDASVTFLKNGKIIFAISEERLSRIKNDGGAFPSKGLKETIEFTGTAKEDVDYLALTHLFFPERYFYRETMLKEIERRFIRMRRKLKGVFTGEFHDPLLSTKNLEDRLQRVGKRLEEHFKEKRFLNDLGFNGARGDSTDTMPHTYIRRSIIQDGITVL